MSERLNDTKAIADKPLNWKKGETEMHKMYGMPMPDRSNPMKNAVDYLNRTRPSQ